MRGDKRTNMKDWCENMIEDAKLHLQNFVAILDKRVAEGAWSGMFKNYEWCLHTPNYGGAGLAICLENMKEEMLVVHLPAIADSVDRYYTCFSKEDSLDRYFIGQQMEYIEDKVKTEDELCERVFKALDLLYETKKHLTGSDFCKYELNPDIEIDEYGVLYHKPSKTLLRCLNPDIEEYWAKEGTRSINHEAFKGLEKFKILVLPESLSDIDYGGITNCNALQVLVLQSLELELLDATINNPKKDEPLLLLVPEGHEKVFMSSGYSRYFLDREKIKRNIISPKDDNCSYRELKLWIETLTSKL